MSALADFFLCTPAALAVAAAASDPLLEPHYLHSHSTSYMGYSCQAGTLL